MESRNSILPLAASLALALGVHLFALAGYAVYESAPASPADRTLEPAPDLTVTDLVASEPRTAGEPAALTATLRNVGDKPTDAVAIDLIIDGQTEQSVVINPPRGGLEPFRHTFTHVVTEPGVHAVRIVVDPANAIDEIDETNNELETLFVWSDPAHDPKSEALPIDLAVATFVVPKPRIAGEPARLLGKIANLGAPIDVPVGVGVLVNGELVATGVINDPVPTAGIIDVELPITVAEPGDYDITLIVDPARALDDLDLDNNRLTRTVRFDPPGVEMKAGQLEDSPVDVNWIAYEDYKELLARKARFDQATTQREVDPVKNAPTPHDPTPPAPKPSPEASRPQPKAVAVVTDPSAAEAIVKPSPEPEKPTQPDEPTDPDVTEPREAPPMTKPTPDTEAAAPTQGEPVGPSRIDATPEVGEKPNPVVDNKPNTPDTKPTPAPPDTGAPDRTVALLTPPIKPEPGDNPLIPEFTPKTDPAKEEAMRNAPDKPVDPEADPAEKSSAVDSSEPGDRVAALPLEPKPDQRPGSPTDRPTDKPEPDRKTEQPDKPKDPKEPTDGAEPKPEQEPTVTVKPSPANPAKSPQESRPTSAPKEERESDPVTRIETQTVRPGSVIARKGLRINTVGPRYSAIARRTSAPANPTAIVSFDRTGKVVNVKLVRSTGYDNVDGPLITAMYKWTAEGPLLKHVAKTWDVPFNIQLGYE